LFVQSATAAEARDSEFLAKLDKQLAEASQMLAEHFTESQQDRYEAFRRSFLKDATVRKALLVVTDKTLGKPALVAVKGWLFFFGHRRFLTCCEKGAAKLFVGDVIEEARCVMDERGEVGAIRPWHIHEA
jgi:transcription initiation factor TFIID subunit 11